MTNITANPAAKSSLQRAVSASKAVQAGWFYNDPAFREAEAQLRNRYGSALAEFRRRLSAAGVTDPQAVQRAEMPLRLLFASQFRSLYNAQAAREQERRDRIREARRGRRFRLLSALLSIATRGLIQAGLNKQKYHHQSSLNAQKSSLKNSPSAALPPSAHPYYSGSAEPEE